MQAVKEPIGDLSNEREYLHCNLFLSISLYAQKGTV